MKWLTAALRVARPLAAPLAVAILERLLAELRERDRPPAPNVVPLHPGDR